MANPIDSKTKRARLQPRREPYWHPLRRGAALGYRKLDAGEGTWIAKWRDVSTGKRHYHALGTLLDGARPAYDQAQRAAESWLRNIERGGAPTVTTVRDACDAYVKATRAAKGDAPADDADGQLRRLVHDDPLARVALSALKPADLSKWRERVQARPARVDRSKDADKTVTKVRSQSAINRSLVPLRAALNKALAGGLVGSDFAWREALKPAKNVGGRRLGYLDIKQRKALVDAASVDIRPLVRALCLLPLRPGALAALKVRDFDPKLAMLHVGDDKGGAQRWVPVSAQMAALLKEQAGNRAADLPLIPRPDGIAWDRHGWKGPIKDAATAAGLPQAITAYTLRHSTITDLVVDGLDLLTVAKLAGTSVAMIEKHYGHLRSERAAAALAGLEL